MAIRYTERLAEAGAVRSVGSRGDSYALAETVVGLFKAELIYRRGPWRSLGQVGVAICRRPSGPYWDDFRTVLLNSNLVF